MSKLMIVAYFILAYLVGSLSGSIILSKLWGLDDIRKYGSGATGMTNALRTHGLAFGAGTFIIDALKGIAIGFLARYLGQDWAVFLGLAVVIGHDYPVFYHFKGGKGIATSFGFLLIYDIRFIGIAFCLFMLAILLTKTVSVASLSASLAAVVYGVVMLVREEKIWPWALILLGLLAIWRHRSNIERILKGEEKPLKLAGKKKN